MKNGNGTRPTMTAIDSWRLNLINAVEAQAQDKTIWFVAETVTEAYLQQSLRWLHRVIEENDPEALKKIIAQAKDEI